MNDRKRFVVIMQALCAAHRVEPSEALLEAYWIGLSDLDAVDFEAGARRALRECVHMPKPRDLRDLSGVMTAESRALSAFDHVSRALGSIGTGRSVRFDDPVIHRVVRMLGGWVKLGQQDSEEFGKWTRKDFIKLYQAFEATPVDDQDLDYLPGHHETANAAAGHQVEPPVLVETRPDRRLLDGHSVVSRETPQKLT